MSYNSGDGASDTAKQHTPRYNDKLNVAADISNNNHHHPSSELSFLDHHHAASDGPACHNHHHSPLR